MWVETKLLLSTCEIESWIASAHLVIETVTDVLLFRHKKNIGLIRIVSDLFSLRTGTFILSANEYHSLVEVSNNFLFIYCYGMNIIY